MGLIVACVALVAATAGVIAVETSSRTLDDACAGVTVPSTVPPGSSIALVSKGEPEVTALAESGNQQLALAGAALRHALGQSNNAEQVLSVLSDVVNDCKALGLRT